MHFLLNREKLVIKSMQNIMVVPGAKRKNNNFELPFDS